MSSEILDRVPPNDIAAERGLLGAALLDPTCLDTVTKTVNQRDFSDSANGRLFDALLTLHDAGKPIGDFKVLVPELKNLGVVEWSNADLGKLIVEGTVTSAGHYASQLRRTSRLRAHIDLAAEVLQRAYNGDVTPEELASWTSARLESIGGHDSSTAPRRLGEIVADLLEDIERNNSAPERGVMTGIGAVDEFVGPVLPGELAVLAARTGEGKTPFATNVGQHNAYLGRRVLLVSLEMSQKEVAQRTLCSVARVNERRLRTGVITASERGELVKAGAELHRLPLAIWAPATATVADIRGVARLAKRTGGLALLIVDYIGIVKPSDPMRSRTEQIGEVMAGLKATAKELEVPVLALCQLNRQAEDRRPTLAMLRDSGSVEQDADVVLFLHRQRDDENVEFICAKHRHGDTGWLRLRFVAQETRFEET